MEGDGWANDEATAGNGDSWGFESGAQGEDAWTNGNVTGGGNSWGEGSSNSGLVGSVEVTAGTAEVAFEGSGNATTGWGEDAELANENAWGVKDSINDVPEVSPKVFDSVVPNRNQGWGTGRNLRENWGNSAVCRGRGREVWGRNGRGDERRSGGAEIYALRKQVKDILHSK